MKSVSTGIDLLSRKSASIWGQKRKKRVAALCHPASVNRMGDHLIHILGKSAKLVSLFGPQHGIYGETQDNMIEWQDHRDPEGRPIYSLYGERRKPTEKSLEGVELVIIDLFDVGARYYTFIYTMAYMLEACGRKNIPVYICDRPNPLDGNTIEGPILDPHYRSFVGLFELPVRHGMTVGELALFFCQKIKDPPDLKIIKLKNWKRSQLYSETGLPWTLPSPNMPSFEAALLYPGMCLLEGTSLSEGRGTTRPFELIGAPFFNWDEIEKEYFKQMKKLNLEPVHFHRQGFVPTFHKYEGHMCKGALQIVKNPKKFRPLRHAAVFLWVVRKIYKDMWDWKDPPYEYEYEKLPIDILAGSPQFRETIDDGRPLKGLSKAWEKDEKKFRQIRKSHLIY